MLWFPFVKKFRSASSKSALHEASMHQARPELRNLLANGSQLRIWLPESLKESMNLVFNHLETTVSRYLREYFVVYLYGNLELIDMQNHKTGIFYSPPFETKVYDSHDSPAFLRTHTVEYVPGLGKNIVPFKIYLNAQIKADLQMLADQSNLTLSHFVREILVSHFLGHTIWPERHQMLKIEHITIASHWESGELEAHSVDELNSKVENALEGKVASKIKQIP